METPPPIPQPVQPVYPSPYSSPPSAEPKSFGVQLAKFSLYVPLLALILGALTSTPAMAATKVYIGYFNGVMILLGLLAGIVALALVPKFGAKGILVHALIGVCANGIFVLAIAFVLLPLMRASTMRQHFAGHWQLVTSGDPSLVNADFVIKPDGSFDGHITTSNSAMTHSIGTWSVIDHTMIDLVIQTVDGQAIPATAAIHWGRMKTVDDQRLILGTDLGDEVYKRLP